MTPFLIILALSLSFGAGIWLGYRVATVKPSGASVPDEHTDLWV